MHNYTGTSALQESPRMYHSGLCPRINTVNPLTCSQGTRQKPKSLLKLDMTKMFLLFSTDRNITESKKRTGKTKKQDAKLHVTKAEEKSKSFCLLTIESLFRHVKKKSKRSTKRKSQNKCVSVQGMSSCMTLLQEMRGRGGH